MDNKILGIVLIVLAVSVYIFKDADLPFRIRIKPVPTVVVPESCRAPIEAIRSIPIGAADARELAAFYQAFARTVEADVDGLFKTAETVREANRRCGSICFGGKGIAGKYPGLAASVDETIAAGIGSRKNGDGTFEPVALDETKRNNLAQALRAIAWAVQQ